jgi:hypothetical protein
MYAESRCGRYRIYDFSDGTYGAAVPPCWRPIERASDGRPRRYRTRAKAIHIAERHAAKAGQSALVGRRVARPKNRARHKKQIATLTSQISRRSSGGASTDAKEIVIDLPFCIRCLKENCECERREREHRQAERQKQAALEADLHMKVRRVSSPKPLKPLPGQLHLF